jgi:hypothetical protein
MIPVTIYVMGNWQPAGTGPEVGLQKALREGGSAEPGHCAEIAKMNQQIVTE